jgi:hypothetical protein
LSIVSNNEDSTEVRGDSGSAEGTGRDTAPASGSNSDPKSDPKSDLRSDLIAALTGRDAGRDRAVAHRTRRVVLGSHGVIQEQKEDKSRARAVALAVTLVVLLLMAPLLWEVTDSLVAGEHLGDPRNQWSLWACIVCPMLLGVAAIAGWWRRRP